MIISDYTYIGEGIKDFFNTDADFFSKKYEDDFYRISIPHGTGSMHNWHNDIGLVRGSKWIDMPDTGISLLSGTLFKTPEWAKRKT